jgi:hypothetical protein
VLVETRVNLILYEVLKLEEQSYELRATDYELEDNLENLNKILVQTSTILLFFNSYF